MYLTMRQVLEGERLPRGYRIAYQDIVLCRSYAYPFGIHYLVRFVRWAYRFSFWYKPGWIETLQIDLYCSVQNERLWRESYMKEHVKCLEVTMSRNAGIAQLGTFVHDSPCECFDEYGARKPVMCDRCKLLSWMDPVPDSTGTET